jgi:hypothetical protein
LRVIVQTRPRQSADGADIRGAQEKSIDTLASE